MERVHAAYITTCGSGRGERAKEFSAPTLTFEVETLVDLIDWEAETLKEPLLTTTLRSAETEALRESRSVCRHLDNVTRRGAGCQEGLRGLPNGGWAHWRIQNCGFGVKNLPIFKNLIGFSFFTPQELF